MNVQQQRARSPRGLWHDWQNARGPQRYNLPEEDKAILLFAALVKALEAVQETHDEATIDNYACGCELCREIDGIQYTLEFLESGFSGGLLVPEKETAASMADLHAAIARHEALTQSEPDPEPDPAPTVVSVPTPSRPRHYWQPQ